MDAKLKKLAKKLKLNPEFKFFPQDELKEIRGYADLYVHCAKVEVEGMACMEAFASGGVPLIAKNNLSSTSIYGLDDKTIYKSKNIKELASKIDYWYENRDVLEEYKQKYIEFGKTLSIYHSADEMLKHFERIINENNK